MLLKLTTSFTSYDIDLINLGTYLLICMRSFMMANDQKYSLRNPLNSCPAFLKFGIANYPE